MGTSLVDLQVSLKRNNRMGTRLTSVAIVQLGCKVPDGPVEVVVGLAARSELVGYTSDPRRTSNLVAFIFAISARMLAVLSWNGAGASKYQSSKV